jgi:hypothetical protein
MSSDNSIDKATCAGKMQKPLSASPNEQNSGSSVRLEFAKVILDFLSKLFYPAILVSVLYLLWPMLSSLDLNKFLAPLQSAKAGDYEFTFAQAQDVGAEIAPLKQQGSCP